MKCTRPQDLNRTAVELENKLRKALLDLGSFRRRVLAHCETHDERLRHPKCPCPPKDIVPKHSTSHHLYDIEEIDSGLENAAAKKSRSLNDISSCVSKNEDKRTSDKYSSTVLPYEILSPKKGDTWERDESSDALNDDYAAFVKPLPKRRKYNDDIESMSSSQSEEKEICGCLRKTSPKPKKCCDCSSSELEAAKPRRRYEPQKSQKRPVEPEDCPCSTSDLVKTASPPKPCECQPYKTPRETLIKRLKAYKLRERKRVEEIGKLKQVHDDLVEQLYRMKRFAQEVSSTSQDNGNLVGELNRLLDERQLKIKMLEEQLGEKETQIVRLMRNEFCMKQKCNQICNQVARRSECPGLKRECQQLLRALHAEMDKVVRKDEVIQKQAKEICTLQCALDKRSAALNDACQEMKCYRREKTPKDNANGTTKDTFTVADKQLQCDCEDATSVLGSCDCDASVTSSTSDSVILKMIIR